MSTNSIPTAGTTRRTFCRAHRATPVPPRGGVAAVARPRPPSRQGPVLLGVLSWALLSAGTILAVGALG